jgi:hypothetical protein
LCGLPWFSAEGYPHLIPFDGSEANKVCQCYAR